jgi:hypothetical protein
MVYFNAKTPDLDIFLRALKWTVLVYFIAIYNILRPLVFFVAIWVYIFQFWHVRTRKNLATLIEILKQTT